MEIKANGNKSELTCFERLGEVLDREILVLERQAILVV